jgi:hypothetical protein
MFEIVTCVRDSKGNDTGRKKYYASESPYKIWEFWVKNSGKPKRKKKSKKLPNAEEASKILDEINKDKE